MPAAAIPQGLLEVAAGRPALAAAHHGRVAVHLLDDDVARGAPLHIGWELNFVHGRAARTRRLMPNAVQRGHFPPLSQFQYIIILRIFKFRVSTIYTFGT